jgi:hypothetical protein
MAAAGVDAVAATTRLKSAEPQKPIAMYRIGYSLVRHDPHTVGNNGQSAPFGKVLRGRLCED